MRTDSTPPDIAASRWQVLLVGALAGRAVATTEGEARRLSRTLERLEGTAHEALRRSASAPADNLLPEAFAHALDELAGD